MLCGYEPASTDVQEAREGGVEHGSAVWLPVRVGIRAYAGLSSWACVTFISTRQKGYLFGERHRVIKTVYKCMLGGRR